MAVKNKKINKLRKVHIWPSVVCFILSLVVMVVAAALTFSFYLEGLKEVQVEQAKKQADSFGKLLLDRVEQGENIEELLSFFAENNYGVDSVYMVDQKKQPVFGVGEFTCIINRPLTGNVVDGVLYADTRQDNAIKDAVVLDPSKAFGRFMRTLLERTSAAVGTEGEETEPISSKEVNDLMEEEVIRSPYWMKVTELPDGTFVVWKNYLCYSMSNLLYAFLSAACVVVLNLIMSSFLFHNIISNFHTQTRNTLLVFCDPVTDGKNRFCFINMAEKVLEKKKNARKRYAIVDLTLEKYRGYCVFHGTQKGEALLKEIDKFFAVKNRLNKNEIFAHTENADFALLLRCSGSNPQEACKKRIEEWLAKLPEVIGHNHAIFHVGVCYVGTAKEFNEDKSGKYRKNVDVVRLLNNAVAAGAQLDENEASGIAEYGEKLLEEQMWEHKVEEMMDEALKNKEFQVYVQPKYNPVNEELVGGEALIRWISPTEGFIGPGRFIPIFEKNGFIAKIDDYMISGVAELQTKWIAEGKKVVPISVNVSRVHFAMPDLAEHICTLVDAYKTPHELIEIELTESAFFDDKKMLLNTVKRLQELGFEVSMDDFGSGYSSLNSLKDMPLDVLKLDAEFFRGESEGNRGEIVVSEAIQLAKSLNMRIVAEGVEKKDQVDFLAGLGCDMIQGYYFAKPMPANDFELRMKSAGEEAQKNEAAKAQENEVKAAEVQKNEAEVMQAQNSEKIRSETIQQPEKTDISERCGVPVSKKTRRKQLQRKRAAQCQSRMQNRRRTSGRMAQRGRAARKTRNCRSVRRGR